MIANGFIPLYFLINIRKATKMLIKLVCLTAFIFIASMAVLVAVTSASGTIVSIGDFELDYNSTIEAPVIVKNVGDVGCGEIKISFNPSVVRVTDVTKGVIGTTSHNINNEAGWVYVNTFSATGESGDVVFAYLTLKAVGNEGDVSYLNISIISLSDTSYGDLAYTTDDGKIVVKTVSPDTPTPTPIPTEPPAGGGSSSGASYITPTPMVPYTPTSTSISLQTPPSHIARTPTLAPSPTPSLEPSPTPKTIQKPAIPGFEAIFAIAGLLSLAHIVWKRKK